MSWREAGELAGLYAARRYLEGLLIFGWCLVVCDVEVGDGDVVKVLDHDNDVVAGPNGSAWRGRGFL